MVSQFHSTQDFEPLIGWELDRVTLDKYHVMLFFNNGWNLLNIASAFSHRSSDGKVDYTFDIYGDEAAQQVSRLLRETIVGLSIRRPDRLTLMFSNEDEFDVHDHPEFCSWWIMPVDDPERPDHKLSWSIWDENLVE
ncbi:MAG: DUF6188 family protein [Pseudomonadota bacterium]